jgi:hypothetical protein
VSFIYIYIYIYNILIFKNTNEKAEVFPSTMLFPKPKTEKVWEKSIGLVNESDWKHLIIVKYWFFYKSSKDYIYLKKLKMMLY